MDFNKHQQAFLYLDRNGFIFFETGGNPLTFQFPENCVKDLEIINQEELVNQIKIFSEQNVLIPANITIILSPSVVFEKDFQTQEESHDEEMQKFLDAVPFELIASKNIYSENGVRIVAANKTLYEEIGASFIKLGSVLDSVIPYEALGENIGLLNDLNVQNAEIVLKKVDTVKQMSFLIDNPATQKSSSMQATKDNKKVVKSNPMRLYVMAGVFVVLLLILGFMLIPH